MKRWNIWQSSHLAFSARFIGMSKNLKEKQQKNGMTGWSSTVNVEEDYLIL